MNIPWDEIRTALRKEIIDNDPSGDDAARRALEMILGEEALRTSVDYYVAVGPASELVRSVLWLLRPWSAMVRCKELAQASNDIETRRRAVYLLQAAADRRALGWVAEFLNDDDPQIQSCGAGVLDQLLWSESVEVEEAEELLLRAAGHANEGVRQRAEFIRSYLTDRRLGGRLT